MEVVVGWSVGFGNGVEVVLEVAGWSEGFDTGGTVGLEVGSSEGLAVTRHTGLLMAFA